MTGNFGFLRAEWPQLYTEARSAERDALFDARTTCFYARRTVEHTVRWIYQVEQLRDPYKTDLSARLHEPAFTVLADRTLLTKMNLIRRLGNAAVHENKPVPKDKGQTALRELFHILSWFARTYARQPSSRPDPALQFDPARLPKPAGQLVAKSFAQINKLSRELEDKDAALQASEADRETLAAELAQVRAELAAVKAANAAVPDTHDYDEARTRADLIDLLLGESGWDVTEPKFREYPVTGMPDGKNGRVDYVLWGADGKPLALVEAKRTTRDAAVGRQQAKLYADCLEQMYGQRPVIYYSNGFDHHIWDDLEYPPRPVQGFHTRDELELLIQRRTTRRKLADFKIAKHIVDRPYQERAIRRVTEHFENN